jgi:ADP-ribosylglycohydrolase
MRVLPLALWHRGTDAELVHDAHEQSLVTHGHLRSQVCCALYCLWARRILDGSGAAWADAVATLRASYGQSAHREELERHVRPDRPPTARGMGYVVDTLWSAVEAMNEASYEDVVRAAIAFGHDTDTTACVAGGIAGARGGVESIPARWRDGLRGRPLVDPLMARLFVR